ERKYGGREAREAAIKIQRAFRSYRLQKRFTTLAIQAIKLQQSQKQQLDNSYIGSEVNLKSADNLDSGHDHQLVIGQFADDQSGPVPYPMEPIVIATKPCCHQQHQHFMLHH